MANDRRDKSGLVHQFEKLNQQVSISVTSSYARDRRLQRKTYHSPKPLQKVKGIALQQVVILRSLSYTRQQCY